MRLLDWLDVIIASIFYGGLRGGVVVGTALFLRRGNLDFLVLALAVLADQLMQGFQIPEHMNPTPAVQVCRFQ